MASRLPTPSPGSSVRSELGLCCGWLLLEALLSPLNDTPLPADGEDEDVAVVVAAALLPAAAPAAA